MYIHRLDTDKPGLFVFRLNAHVTEERRQAITETILESINEYAEGSKVLLLSPEFDSVPLIPKLQKLFETDTRFGKAFAPTGEWQRTYDDIREEVVGKRVFEDK